jgi:hypothetical protein
MQFSLRTLLIATAFVANGKNFDQLLKNPLTGANPGYRLVGQRHFGHGCLS